MISRQIGGPSLLASAGTVSQSGGPGRADGLGRRPDRRRRLLGQRHARDRAEQPRPDRSVTGQRHRTATLVATIHVRSLTSLAVSSAVGGPDASWIDPLDHGQARARPATATSTTPAWTTTRAPAASRSRRSSTATPPGFPPANAAEHTKYLSYPQTHQLSSSQASYNAARPARSLCTSRARTWATRADGTRALQRHRVHGDLDLAAVLDDAVQPDRRRRRRSI